MTQVDPQSIQAVLANLGEDEISDALDTLKELKQLEDTNKLVIQYADTAANGCVGGPYEWQREFHDSGADHPERAIIAANQVGKTRCAGIECAIHLTGLYPKWWRGRRFNTPTSGIAANVSNELVRDITQLELCGPMKEGVRELSGEGWIPADRIVDWTFMAGVPNTLDTLSVRHVTGGMSTLSFKSYKQSYLAFQGVRRHFVWLDEEPEDDMIYSESLTRLAALEGIMIFTRTPLFGNSQIVKHFIDGGPGIWRKFVSWKDAPHLTEARKAQLSASYADHERDTRTTGVPMMGTGGVYTVPPRHYVVEPRPISAHWRRLCGIDFGIDHPAAAVWIAYDADADCIYVYDAYRKSGETALYHAAAITARGKWIPVAWPHDGMVRDKGGGEALAEQYRMHGANLLPQSARGEDEKGGSKPREPITIHILERMRTDRLKVFSHLTELLEELRMLYREKGQIVAKNDDMESALRYAVMDLMHAITLAEADVDPQTIPHRMTSVADYDPYATLRTSP